MIRCRVPIRSMTRRIGIKRCGCAALVVSVARVRHLGGLRRGYLEKRKRGLAT